MAPAAWLPALLLAAAAGAACVRAASHQLPNIFTRCKQNDPNFEECLRKATQEALPNLKTGIPSLGVAPLDPMQVTSIDIGQGNGPIAINMKFNNIIVKGLSDAKVQTGKSDLKGYNLNYNGAIDSATFEADYEMNGRILLLPVTGKGRCKLTFSNIQARLGPKGKGTMKKGKLYFEVTDFPLNIYGLSKLEVNFENLFNGDKTLGKSMNTLLNENWQDLWGELRPAFEQSFGQIFLLYTKNIFDKVAYNDIFLE